MLYMSNCLELNVYIYIDPQHWTHIYAKNKQEYITEYTLYFTWLCGFQLV